MARDQTRNIETFKIGGSHLNEFEFHQHQGEMAERFDKRRRTAGADKPLTKAERVAELMEQARQKVRKRKKHH